MNEDNLRAELQMAEAALWQPFCLRWFHARGFEAPGLVDKAPGIGVGRVEWLAGGYWQPYEGGSPAVVAAVWVHPPVDLPNGTRSMGVLSDLAAINLTDGSVALRIGLAYALGEHMLEQEDRPFRVRCHVDAREWLKASGDGVVPLDWRTFTTRTSGEPRINILADTVPAGEEVERRMRETLTPLPRVLVRSDRRAA